MPPRFKDLFVLLDIIIMFITMVNSKVFSITAF